MTFSLGSSLPLFVRHSGSLARILQWFGLQYHVNQLLLLYYVFLPFLLLWQPSCCWSDLVYSITWISFCCCYLMFAVVHTLTVVVTSCFSFVFDIYRFFFHPLQRNYSFFESPCFDPLLLLQIVVLCCFHAGFAAVNLLLFQAVVDLNTAVQILRSHLETRRETKQGLHKVHFTKRITITALFARKLSWLSFYR